MLDNRLLFNLFDSMYAWFLWLFVWLPCLTSLIRCNRTEGVSVRWCYGIWWQWTCDALMVSAISVGQVRAMMVLDRCASKDNSDKCESCGQVWVRDRRAGVGPTDRCESDDSKLAAGRCNINPGCSRCEEQESLAMAIRLLIARVVLFGRWFTFRHLSVGYPEDDMIRSRSFRICIFFWHLVYAGGWYERSAIGLSHGYPDRV